MRTFTVAGPLLVALLLVAGCGGDRAPRATTVTDGAGSGTRVADASAAESTPAVPQDAAGEELTKREARAALPKVTDLPTGWSTDPDKVAGDDESAGDTDERYSPGRCKAVFEPLDKLDGKRTVRQEATFRKSVLGPYLAVGIASYSGEMKDEQFAAVVEAFNDCPSFTVTDADGPAKFTASPLSLPNLGDETLALRFAASAQDTDFEVDAISVRVGHNVISVLQIALAGLDSGASEKAALSALANLEEAA